MHTFLAKKRGRGSNTPHHSGPETVRLRSENPPHAVSEFPVPAALQCNVLTLGFTFCEEEQVLM